MEKPFKLVLKSCHHQMGRLAFGDLELAPFTISFEQYGNLFYTAIYTGDLSTRGVGSS